MSELYTRGQRSRTGCLTCRRRKKKCGEQRPSCETCVRLKLDCEYPAPGQGRKNRKRKHSTYYSSSSEESPESSHSSKHARSPLESEPTPHHIHDKSDPIAVLSDNPVSMHSIGMSDSAASYSHYRSLSSYGESVGSPDNGADTGLLTRTMSNSTDLGVDSRHHQDERSRQDDLFNMPLDLSDLFPQGVISPLPNASPNFNFLNSPPASLLGIGPPSVSYLPLPPSPTLSDLKEVYPELDEEGHMLFDYFCHTQSLIMSVSPQNNFQKVFARMARTSRPVLCGVLAWAAFHRHQSEEDVSRGHTFVAEATALVQDEELQRLLTREELLASLLLLASANICSGDVQNWRQYLSLAADVIKKHGGVSGFMQSDSVLWLLKNYAYHEILASSSRQTPQLFSSHDLKLILQYGPNVLPDTLCACCQPILSILATINELSREVRQVLGDRGNSIDLKAIQKITEQAADLEQQIYRAKPDREMILNLDGEDSKTQIVLFEAFQHLSILYLYDSVLHMNSSSLQIRSINELLLSTIDILLGTRVEGILIFPLFMAGVTCCVKSTRPAVLARFDQLFARNQAHNIRQACNLLREVWANDDMGTKHVDWNELAELKGWHLSFA